MNFVITLSKYLDIDRQVRILRKTTTLFNFQRFVRLRPQVSGYFRIRYFFFPDTATVQMYLANSTANPEKNKSALQSGKKYIRNESDNVWTGPAWKKIKSGYFFVR